MNVELSVDQLNLIIKALGCVSSQLVQFKKKPSPEEKTAMNYVAETVDFLERARLSLYHSKDVSFMVSNNKRFHHEHSQWWADCQIVTAVNAATFLGLPVISPYLDEPTYKQWIKYTGTDIESSIDEGRIKQLHEYLRMKTVEFVVSFQRVQLELQKGFPVELSIQYSKNDDVSHSSLIVDVKKNKVRILNTRGAGCRDGWIDWSVIYRLAHHYALNHTAGKVIARSFRPTEQKPWSTR